MATAMPATTPKANPPFTLLTAAFDVLEGLRAELIADDADDTAELRDGRALVTDPMAELRLEIPELREESIDDAWDCADD